MSIYSCIYLFLAIVIILIVAFQHLDMLSVAAVCFVVYSIYCIPGIGISGFYRPHLSSKLYGFVYLQMIIIIFVLLKRTSEQMAEQGISHLKKHLVTKEEIENVTVTRAYGIYTIIMLLFMLMNVIRIGFDVFAAGKLLVWEKTDIFYLISLYGAFPSFAYGIRYHKYWMAISGLLIELTIFFAGSRAFLATMMIILLCEWGYRLWKQNKSSLRVYLIGALAILFLLIYRAIDVYIMKGDISGALNVLKQPETWAKALEFNEPRVIIANYDYALTTNMKLPLADVIYRIVDFIPGITKIVPFKLTYPEYYSTWLQEAVHGSEGVGGTIWGESYSMFGILGIPVITIVWLSVVSLCNRHIMMPRKGSPFLIAAGVYLAWYINRLDYNRVGQVVKVMLFCYLLWAGIYLVLGGVLEWKKRRVILNNRQIMSQENYQNQHYVRE